MSEGLHGPPYAPDHIQGSIGRESVGRYPPTTANEWSGRDPGRQMGHASPNFAITTNSDQASVNNHEAPTAFPRRGSNQIAADVTNVLGGRQNDQSDGTFEWDEYAVEE